MPWETAAARAESISRRPLQGVQERLHRVRPAALGGLEEAHVLQGVDDAALVPVLLAQVERLLPVGERAVVLTFEEEDVADVVVALGELLLVAQLAPDAEGLLVVPARLGVLPPSFVERPQVGGHVREALPIADGRVDLAGGAQVGLRLGEVAPEDPDASPVLQAHRGAALVADPLPDLGRLAVPRDRRVVFAETLMRHAPRVQHVRLPLLVSDLGHEGRGRAGGGRRSPGARRPPGSCSGRAGRRPARRSCRAR